MGFLKAVEVVYATAQEQWLLQVPAVEGATARSVIAASGLLQRCPELVLDRLDVGVFGRRCSLDAPVRAGDRVEIYRPLLIDPKTARRQRAARASAQPR